MKTLKDLPKGSLVRLGSIDEKPIIWRILDHDHLGYPVGSTTLLTDSIIAFAAFDAVEPDNENAGRAKFANNNWYDACLRTWLNSVDKSWYTPTHSWDMPPEKPFVTENPYVDKPGFLSGFSENEKNILLKTVVSYDGYKKNDYYSVDKVFLLSATEVGLKSSDKDGGMFSYFANINNLYNECNWWWLRTSDSHTSCEVCCVSSNGTLNSICAYYGTGGVRLACNPASSTHVTDTPDKHGVYNLVFGGESCAL